MAKHKPQKKSLAPRSQATPPTHADFDEVLRLIDAARTRALTAVNQELVSLYWQIGEYISRKLESAAWGEGVVEQLADHIARAHPDLRGFTRSNLLRMRQFYETYRGDEKVAPLVRQLPWTHNLLILSRAKRAEEREFYLRMALRERWSKRELERQLNGALFERVVLSPAKVSPPVTQLHPGAATVFKDSYLLDFLNLPAAHSEDDLQRALGANLRHFLLELGTDFAFVGERYRLHVGGRNFFEEGRKEHSARLQERAESVFVRLSLCALRKLLQLPLREASLTRWRRGQRRVAGPAGKGRSPMGGRAPGNPGSLLPSPIQEPARWPDRLSSWPC
jgi:predicted nuclease of restriction endonuclease-like (RecB) superfamily